MDTKNTNIENRIARRAQSIFASFGQVVNDFYLEAGIYFVGGFNAALVAWDIFTSLVSDGQPMVYAVSIAIVAFIAVEGLAVYLVGAAAKTNNGLLWFFSVVFAAFFTYAHYQEMTAHVGIISQYITLAIPFFVVVGYWARTVKIDTETGQTHAAQKRDSERARQQQIEDEERARQQQIEDEERRAKLELKRLDTEQKHTERLAKIEAEDNRKFSGSQPEISDRKNVQNSGNGGQPDIFTGINSSRKMEKAEILEQLPGLVQAGKTNTEIGEIVGRNERTIRNYRKQLNGNLTKS
jgi:hypothetical protein